MRARAVNILVRMSPSEVCTRDDRTLTSIGRPVDVKALGRIRRRLRAAGAAPWLHVEVARRMAERLTIMKARPALVLNWEAYVGGGHATLAAAYPAARVVPVEVHTDPAATVRPQARWEWLRAAARGLLQSTDKQLGTEDIEPGQAGLVWANMTLHGHADPSAQFSAWCRALEVDGFLMFSTLGPGTLSELRSLYAKAHWGSPMAPLVDMHDLGDMLVEAGFADPVMDQEQIVLTWPDASAALEELRSLGGNADTGRHAGCRTPRWHASLVQALDTLSLSRPDGRVALTFEIVYGHAFKPAPRVNLSPETRVDIREMKQMLSAHRVRRP